MLKVCTLFKRKPGLTVGEYQGYWQGEHPSFVRRLPGLRQYTQNPPLAESFEEGSPVYDGVVELWFDDSAALKHLATTQEYEALNKDEEQFVDRSTIRLLLTDEAVLKEGARAEDQVKRITFFKRAAGMSPTEFQRRWSLEYGARVAASSEVVRYVQCVPRIGGYRDGKEPEWDGIDMCWFEDLTAAKRDDAAAALTAIASTDQPPRLFTRERRVIRLGTAPASPSLRP